MLSAFSWVSCVTWKTKTQNMSSITKVQSVFKATRFSPLLSSQSSKSLTSFISITMNRDVNHDVATNAFVLHLGKDGKEKAILEYVKEGDNVLNFWHTEVPVSHRGQGLGAHLAKAAFDYAVEKNFHVKPSCTYIQKYLKDINPQQEYLERVLPLE